MDALRWLRIAVAGKEVTAGASATAKVRDERRQPVGIRPRQRFQD